MDENYFNAIKGVLIGIISAILAYLAPVYYLLLCIGLSFAGNFFWGYLAGIITQHESFCLKKAKVAMYEILVYAMLIAVIFFIGEKMGNKELVLKCLSIVTWAWIYFYLVNIFKNLRRLFPKSRGLFFIYFIISLEFIKQFPYMKEFLEAEKKEQSVD